MEPQLFLFFYDSCVINFITEWFFPDKLSGLMSRMGWNCFCVKQTIVVLLNKNYQYLEGLTVITFD